MAAINLTQIASTGAGAGYLTDRNYQIWDTSGDTPNIRRKAFFVGSPDWGANTPTAGDVVSVLELGPTTTGGGALGVCEYVIAAFINVITASTQTGSTGSLGDVESATQYITTFSLTSVAMCVSPFSLAKLYTTADFLKLTTGTSGAAGAVVDCGVISFSFAIGNNNF